MTKKEIVKQIADQLRIPQAQAKKVVDRMFQSIIDTLVKEGRIELRNFGVFVVKQRRPRNARNPVTNEPVQVEAKKVVTFQPGKIMEEKVRDAEKYTESKRRQLKGPQSVEGRSAPRDRYGKPKPSASPAEPHHSPQPDQTPENLTLPSALSDDLPEGLQ